MSTPNYRLAEVIDQWDFDIFSICLVVLLHLGVTQKQLPYLRVSCTLFSIPFIEEKYIEEKTQIFVF